MEKLNIKGMIESILLDMVNNNPIDSYVFKIQMIVRSLRNEQLSSWIGKELDGYDDKDMLPPHRIVKTRVIANLFINNGAKVVTLKKHEMPLYTLDAEKAKSISTIHIRNSIIAINNLITTNKEGELGYSVTEYEKYLLSTIYEWSTILNAHKPVIKADFEFIIYKFKSTLLDLFMELNDTIFNDNINFDVMTEKKEIDKIVNQTINTGVYVADNGTANISDSTLVGGKKNNVQISISTKKELEDIVSKIEVLTQGVDQDRIDIADAIITIREELNTKIPRPKFLRTAFNSLKAIGKGIATDAIVGYINQALNIIPK